MNIHMLPIHARTKVIALVLLIVSTALVVYIIHAVVMAPVVVMTKDTEQGVQNEERVRVQVQDRESTPNTISSSRTLESAEVMVVRDLSGQRIKEVPQTEFERLDTEVLDLSRNELVSIPAEVRKLSRLKILNLSNNKLTNIPAELGQLSELESLELANNRLTGLPYELGNLKNLQLLDLRGNNYSESDLAVIKEGIPKAIILTDLDQ